MMINKLRQATNQVLLQTRPVSASQCYTSPHISSIAKLNTWSVVQTREYAEFQRTNSSDKTLINPRPHRISGFSHDKKNGLKRQGGVVFISSATQRAPRVKRTLDPISITPRAAERISNLLRDAKPKEGQKALGIRLGVKRRGCNGLSYTLNYVYDPTEYPQDNVVRAMGVDVYVDPMALFSVVGTVMDWEETELSAEFTFTNPNSKGECGCGESFTV